MTGPSHREMEGGEDKKAKSVRGGGKGRRPFFPPPTCPTGAAVLTPARRCSRQPTRRQTTIQSVQKSIRGPDHPSPPLAVIMTIAPGGRSADHAALPPQGRLLLAHKNLFISKRSINKKTGSFPPLTLVFLKLCNNRFWMGLVGLWEPLSAYSGRPCNSAIQIWKARRTKKRSRRSQNHMYRCTNPLYFSSSDP